MYDLILQNGLLAGPGHFCPKHNKKMQFVSNAIKNHTMIMGLTLIAMVKHFDTKVALYPSRSETHLIITVIRILFFTCTNKSPLSTWHITSKHKYKSIQLTLIMHKSSMTSTFD